MKELPRKRPVVAAKKKRNPSNEPRPVTYRHPKHERMNMKKYIIALCLLMAGSTGLMAQAK